VGFEPIDNSTIIRVEYTIIIYEFGTYVNIYKPPNNINPINLFLLYKNAGKIVPNNRYGNVKVMFGLAIIVEIVNEKEIILQYEEFL
jgi:hypothetical protein